MFPAPSLWLLVAAPFAGSFLGVVVKRVDDLGSIVWDRSRCEHCRHVLEPRDLVPVVSWVVSGGRCRHCGAPISLFYPAFELGAFAIALWAAASASGWPMWATAIFGWLLLTLATIDARVFLLPDVLTLPLIPAGLAVNAALDRAVPTDQVIGAVAGYLFVIVIRVAYRRLRGREGIGMGDAKLLAAAGAWVSWQGLPSVIAIAAFTGLAMSLLAAARGTSLSLTDRVPFGTFLCLGTWIVWFYGPLA
jgi:leader peptidase (prepilin peptidase) / N-methyltransferase